MFQVRLTGITPLYDCNHVSATPKQCYRFFNYGLSLAGYTNQFSYSHMIQRINKRLRLL